MTRLWIVNGITYDERGIAILDEYSQKTVNVGVRSSPGAEIAAARRMAANDGFVGTGGAWHHDPYTPGRMMYIDNQYHGRGHHGGGQTWRSTRSQYSCK